MAKIKNVEINGVKYKLQSVSPTWYYEHNDKCGMTGGKKNMPKYMDGLFRNCVLSPAEVRNDGMAFFDENHDIKGAEDLTREIEDFLREGDRPGGSVSEGKA